MTMLPKKPEDGGQATEKHVAEVEDVQVQLEEQEQELEDKTQARLDAVMRGEGVPDEPEPELAEKSDEEDDSTLEEKDEKPAEKSDEKDDSTPDDEEGKKAEDGEKGKEAEEKEIPPLSDAYYRAAVHRGWKEEDIKDFYESSPELCVKTLGNIYEALNRSSKEFASLGRIHKEQMAQAAQQPAKPVVEEAVSEFKGIDFKALENSDLDESTIAAFKAINEQNRLSFEAQKKTKPAQETVQPSGFTPQQIQTTNREAAALEQQIEGFFTGSVKGYEDFYGVVPKSATDWEMLSPGQRMNRWTTIQMMDELMAGAVAYGREITVDEALQRAHLSVSESEREKVIREELKSKLTKRGKSLTLKPSGSAKVKGSQPKTDEDLETVTQARLNKLFG